MAKCKYWSGCLLTTKLGMIFKITGVRTRTSDSIGTKKLYYLLEGHGHKELPVDYIDSSDHLTCINRTKAGKLLWSK